MKTTKLTTANSFRMAMSIALLMLVLSSCEKEPFNRYGFDSDFGNNSSGLTIMSISSQVSSIRLSGDIFMDSGEMKIEFIDPEGFIVYTRNFFAPKKYFVNETLKASQGMWKLRYTSLEGTGSIDLHVQFR